MEIKIQTFVIFICSIVSYFSLASSTFVHVPKPSWDNTPGGTWELLRASLGMSAMHMQLLHNNRVIMFDRTDFGPSNLTLPNGKCKENPKSKNMKIDCTAHSLSYDIASNSVRALTVETDTWCSSGTIAPDGTLIQTGGYREGERVIRTFTPCDDDQCDWVELEHRLSQRRWYASNQILPDGDVIIVGGRKAFTYEFFPRKENSPVNYYMQFLKDTRDPSDENNLYPFLYLLPDGNIYIFANRHSILFDYKNDRVLKKYPLIPGEKRSYPSTGTSVMLPIELQSANDQSPPVEILICGGSPEGAYAKAESGTYVKASQTCGRMKVTDPNPEWKMETMPIRRVMPDMVLLPTGDVVIVNGAQDGTAGWEDATNPVFNPVLYRTNDEDHRFSVLAPSEIPRMYHAVAILIPDGRILVSGSNPHVAYNFTSEFPTDLSLEAFSPPYLAAEYIPLRPTILTANSLKKSPRYRRKFSISFVLPGYCREQELSVSIVTPAFVTHSVSLNQRLIKLHIIRTVRVSSFAYKAIVAGPPSNTIAPPGYYMMFLVHEGVPSPGVWVKLG